MTKAKRKDSPNDDLVEAVEAVLPHILMFYKRFEAKGGRVLAGPGYGGDREGMTVPGR